MMCYCDWTGLRWYEPQFINLSSVIYSHPSSHWGLCLSKITWVWCFPVELQVVLVWVDGWGLCMVVTNHTAYWVVISVQLQCSYEFETDVWSKISPLFLFVNKGKGSGALISAFDEWQFCMGQMDCNGTLRAMTTLSHCLQVKKNL